MFSHLCVLSLNQSLHHSHPTSFSSLQLPLCISSHRLLRHTSFICYWRLFATRLWSVCLCMKGLHNSSAQAAGGVWKGRRIKPVSRQVDFVWSGLVTVCVCVEPVFHHYHQSVHSTVSSRLPASTHPSNTWHFPWFSHSWYFHSFVHPSLDNCGLIIHLSHSSVCLLIHSPPHPSISCITTHLSIYYTLYRLFILASLLSSHFSECVLMCSM